MTGVSAAPRAGERERSAAGRTWRRHLVRLMAVAGIALAGYLLYRGLRRYSLSQIMDSVRDVPVSHLAMALGFAAASYLCLTGFDWLGVRYVGHRLSYPRVALASFVSLSLGQTIGFAGLSSGPIRYRFYRRWNLTAGEVTKLVLLCGTTVGLGLLGLGAVALLAQPGTAVKLTGLAPTLVRLSGGACLLLVILYLVLSARLRRGLTIRGWTLELPPLWIALAQVVLGSVNFACVAGCLYASVSTASQVSYFQVASAYITGNVMALLTHVPGGLGVMEGAVMYLLPNGGRLIGALIVFRLAYFLVPLVIGLVVFLIAELTKPA